MKGVRKRAKSRAVAPRRLMMKLPPQALPIMRHVSHDPVGIRLAGSDLSECLRCFATCRGRGGPFQSICEEMCAAYCDA